MNNATKAIVEFLSDPNNFGIVHYNRYYSDVCRALKDCIETNTDTNIIHGNKVLGSVKIIGNAVVVDVIENNNSYVFKLDSVKYSGMIRENTVFISGIIYQCHTIQVLHELEDDRPRIAKVIKYDVKY